MKKVTISYYVAGLILIFATSCRHASTPLEQAFVLSGSNRVELELVIHHYSQRPEDSLKLKAAIFLIENMPGHYSYYGPSLNSYKENIDSSIVMQKLPWSIRNIFYSYPYQDVYALKNVRRIEDIKCITASYLINNIEKAFESWQYPWARHLNFRDFCEYLLPYRISNEPINNWRDSIGKTYQDILERMKSIDELSESPYQACLQVNDQLIAQMKQAREDSICFTHPLIGTKDMYSMGCPEYVPTTVLIMRSLGISVSAEMIEQWSTRRGQHYWNTVYHFTGLHYPFTGFESRPRGLNQDYKMNKVYRRTYAINHEALLYQKPNEPIPTLFEDRFLQDVTNEYMTCHNITVNLELKPSEEREYAYLCVFNNETWTPVSWGRVSNKHVTFKNVGPQTLFIAGYYVNDKIQPASLPFYINLEGKVNYVSVSQKKYTTLRISRKYPLLHRFSNYSRHLIGATIETSDYKDFRRVDTIGIICHDAETQFDSLYTKPQAEPYRYLRIKHSTNKMELSELEIYSTDTTRCLYGKIFLAENNEATKSKIYSLYNKAITDYVEITNWIGIDLYQKTTIKKIKYLPRTDSNHIMSGDTYELFYYNDFKFCSLGKQQATSSFIEFNRIPTNGLYLLKNRSGGTEHRIFTYENNQLHFW